MKLQFHEEKHEYISPEENIDWLSATTLIGAFKQPFSPDQARKSSKNKKSKWYGLPESEILSIWSKEAKRATDLGTWYHNQQEKLICEIETIERDGFVLPIFTPLYEENIKYAPDQKLTDGIYPEHFMYLQSAGVCGQSDRVEVVNSVVNIRDYKGLSLDTDIPTLDGFKNMKDIQKGDIIFDGEGKSTEVINISEIHYNPCYELKFDTNDRIIADHEHRWVISIRNMDDKTNIVSYIEEEKTTEELFTLLNNGEKLRIKCIPSLELPETFLPIDPYLFGAWLGDGHKACGMITNMSPDFWKELENRGYTLGEDVSGEQGGKAQSRTVLGIYPILKKLNLLMNKHIPDIYLRASHKQRLDLLRGLMDTDGYYNKTRKRCVMVTTQKWQADAMMQLVSSLGWKPTIIKATTKCTNCADPDKKIDTYHVTFRVLNDSPFLTRNFDYKIVSKGKNNTLSKYRYIKSIQKIDTVPTKCLEVDSLTHTYLATRNYIKTHNTNKEVNTRSYKSWDDIYQKMQPPLQHLEDCHINHYALQLSLYMYMILKHNPKLKPGSLAIEHIKFEEAGRDKYDYPITYMDDQGNPVVESVTVHEVPYLKSEIITLLAYIKDNRAKIKKK